MPHFKKKTWLRSFSGYRDRDLLPGGGGGGDRANANPEKNAKNKSKMPEMPASSPWNSGADGGRYGMIPIRRQGLPRVDRARKPQGPHLRRAFGGIYCTRDTRSRQVDR